MITCFLPCNSSHLHDTWPKYSNKVNSSYVALPGLNINLHRHILRHINAVWKQFPSFFKMAAKMDVTFYACANEHKNRVLVTWKPVSAVCKGSFRQSCSSLFLLQSRTCRCTELVCNSFCAAMATTFICCCCFLKEESAYVSLRLRVQNAVPAQPCVGKIWISLVLLNFLHCNFRLWFETP